eukprot:GHRQ01024360.1.p1 GENE.GHRQ01024360.1~~GHRQ01024360.1.p1  ORF type:complete len:372 (+),score=128.94 GHRQ01024360.1:144-1118(+)
MGQPAHLFEDLAQQVPDLRGRITIYCIAESLSGEALEGLVAQCYPQASTTKYSEVLHVALPAPVGEPCDAFFFEYGVVCEWARSSCRVDGAGQLAAWALRDGSMRGDGVRPAQPAEPAGDPCSSGLQVRYRSAVQRGCFCCWLVSCAAHGLQTRLLARPSCCCCDPTASLTVCIDSGGLTAAAHCTFNNAAAGCWGFRTAKEEQELLQQVAKKAQQRPLPPREVEVDRFEYNYSSVAPPSMQNDTITISRHHSHDHQTKLAICHALAQSTKLCVYEERVVELVLDTKHLPQVRRGEMCWLPSLSCTAADFEACVKRGVACGGSQ